MTRDIAYAVLLRPDPQTLQEVTRFRSAWLQDHSGHTVMPPRIVVKALFRPCVPCGVLVQRLQVSLQDFPAVPLHLSELRWLPDGTLHWDASLTETGEQNMGLLHLKTKVWSTVTSLVSLFCEFTPGEPFSYRTNNPWQPGSPLLRLPEKPRDLPPLPEPRKALGTVMELYRVTLHAGEAVSWEHITSFPGVNWETSTHP